MLYVVGLIKNIPNSNSLIRRYKLIDTLSELQMNLTPNILKHVILKSKMQVANANIHNDGIELHDWVNQIDTSDSGGGTRDFILLAKSGDRYKVATRHGVVTKVSSDELQESLDIENVANCKYIGDKNTWLDTYEIIVDTQFNESISKRYKEFTAKAQMLGYGSISFKYEIENHQVKLIKYTGSSRDVILPSFITAIRINAFRGITLNTLNLNEGLQVIGTRAFAPRNMSKGLANVEIPSTVQLIGHEAFANNFEMIGSNRSLAMSKVKMRNNNTIMLDGYI